MRVRYTPSLNRFAVRFPYDFQNFGTLEALPNQEISSQFPEQYPYDTSYQQVDPVMTLSFFGER
jgi:hypothetical protein